MARPKLDLERIKRELPTANDYLDTEYGIQGTPEREEFTKNAMDYYSELTKEDTNLKKNRQMEGDNVYYNNDPRFINDYEDEYKRSKKVFLIENPEKKEIDFIESKIEQFTPVELEYKRKSGLSDDEVHEEFKKHNKEKSYKKFKPYLIEHRQLYAFKEKNEDSLHLKFYKRKLQNLLNTRITNEEIQLEEIQLKEKTPFKIALLKELGFLDLDIFKNKSKENQYAIIGKITGENLRSIRGNILVLNPKSTEDRSKYTSIDKLETAKKYIDKLK